MYFDAGLFFILLGTAILMFFIKVPYREAFMFVSCAIFITLGFVLYSDMDIAFISYSTVYDGVTTLTGNTTNYVIGDSTENYNETGKSLATFFIIIGIVTGAVSSVMFMDTRDRK